MAGLINRMQPRIVSQAHGNVLNAKRVYGQLAGGMMTAGRLQSGGHLLGGGFALVGVPDLGIRCKPARHISAALARLNIKDWLIGKAST